MKTEPLVFHIREADIFKYIMGDAAKTIRHLDLLFHGGVTLAFKETLSGWVCAEAHTGPGDSFNRKLGRKIAVGRLNCLRKKLYEDYGHEKPTYEDALVLADLILHERM